VGRRTRLALTIGVAIAAVLAVLSIFAITSGSDHSHKRAPFVAVADLSASQRAALLRSFDGFTARNGDGKPSDILLVGTTRQVASETLWGVRIPQASNPKVYVLQGNGSFVGNDAHVPARGGLPTGTIMTALFTSPSSRVLDWRITPTPRYTVDIHRLGPAIHLP
jgi:hypothetical protein